MIRLVSAVVVLAWLSGQAALAWAKPLELTSLFPAGASRGQTVPVTATGQFDRWPVRVWVDRPGIQVDTCDEKGKLAVTVQDDARCGMYLVRLVGPEGATGVRPFFVGGLPELLESEPNDRPAEAQSVVGCGTVSGKLARGGDVDTFAVTLLAGQTLIASLQANRHLASPMDPVLQICTPGGQVLEQNDDTRGLDAQIVFTAPKQGTFLVRTFAFPADPNSSIGLAGGASYVYRLTLTTGGFVDHTLPLAVSRGTDAELDLFGWNISPAAGKLRIPTDGCPEQMDVFHSRLVGATQLLVRDHACLVATEPAAPEPPMELPTPVTISGRIDRPGDVDEFLFHAENGSQLTLSVESDQFGSPLDPVLRVTDASGKSLLDIDDASKGRDVVASFTAPADGWYRLAVTDAFGHGGMRFVYRLSMEPPKRDYQLRLATDRFVLPSGAEKSLEIAVAVERTGGFDARIELTATDLPAGIEQTPAVSLGEGETAKEVKLVIQAAAGPAEGTFRIIGRASDDDGPAQIAHVSLDSFGTSLSDVWLTVLPTAAEPKAE